MKKLFIICTLIFCALFSETALANEEINNLTKLKESIKIGLDVAGDNDYLIKKNNPKKIYITSTIESMESKGVYLKAVETDNEKIVKIESVKDTFTEHLKEGYQIKPVAQVTVIGLEEGKTDINFIFDYNGETFSLSQEYEVKEHIEPIIRINPFSYDDNIFIEKKDNKYIIKALDSFFNDLEVGLIAPWDDIYYESLEFTCEVKDTNILNVYDNRFLDNKKKILKKNSGETTLNLAFEADNKIYDLTYNVVVENIAPQAAYITISDIQYFFEVPPQTVNDRLLVPLRLFEKTAAKKIDWAEESRTAIVESNEGDIIEFRIDEKEILLNNQAVDTDVYPIIINDRIMLPLRFIAETLGYRVDWDEDNSHAYIYY